MLHILNIRRPEKIINLAPYPPFSLPIQAFVFVSTAYNINITLTIKGVSDKILPTIFSSVSQP